MPSYDSHAVHAEKLYEKLVQEKLLKIELDVSKIRSYSIAHDYAYLVKNLDNHNERTKAYILYLTQYIKKNHLENDTEVVAFLYGHIAHFFLDSFVHPFVNFLANGCINTGFMSGHFIIEGYLDQFFVENVLNKNFMDINETYFNKADFNNPVIKELINISYHLVYGKDNVLNSFQVVRKFFSALEVAHKRIFRTKNLKANIMNTPKFMTINELTYDEMTNSNHLTWKNPVSGSIHTESVIELFYKSLDEALTMIQDINLYIYGNRSFSKIEREVPNISLDTGVRCRKNPKMFFKRMKETRNSH